MRCFCLLTYSSCQQKVLIRCPLPHLVWWIFFTSHILNSRDECHMKRGMVLTLITLENSYFPFLQRKHKQDLYQALARNPSIHSNEMLTSLSCLQHFLVKSISGRQSSAWNKCTQYMCILETDERYSRFLSYVLKVSRRMAKFEKRPKKQKEWT